jgi:quercetin dioxygenase-like cupin family protein
MPDGELFLPDLVRALPRRGDAVPAHYLETPGCDVLFVTAPAGSSLPPHTHDTDNATVVVSGETVLTTAQGEHRYGAGEWYETHAHELHALRFDVDTVQVELRFAVSAPDA